MSGSILATVTAGKRKKRAAYSLHESCIFFFAELSAITFFKAQLSRTIYLSATTADSISSLEMHAAICAKNVYVNLPHTATSFIVSPKTLSINPLDSPSECTSSRDRVRWLHHRLFGDFPRTASIKRDHN